MSAMCKDVIQEEPVWRGKDAIEVYAKMYSTREK